ncbi:MAG: methylated-DNA--[Clostridia bacterium]|nr:methylated-DNA--[protein]-cysteine S-methyltransferase [Clostridia bacterium]
MPTILLPETPIGALTVQEDAGAICAIRFGICDTADSVSTPLLQTAKEELTAYFAGKLRTFTVPISLHGTSFSLRVWEALREIPYGQTVSYGELAVQIGNPKAARAVGMANHRNPIPIILPCHRVIGSNGNLVGYAGGLAAKTRLLALERENFTR